MPIEPKIYDRIFQMDKDGQAILEELARLFYDRPSYTQGDTHETAYKEGQRSVVAFLIRKCGLVNEEANENKASFDAQRVVGDRNQGGRE